MLINCSESYSAFAQRAYTYTCLIDYIVLLNYKDALELVNSTAWILLAISMLRFAPLSTFL